MAKKKARVRLLDTTFRDAQQSLLGGYLRTEEILPIAAEMDSIGFTAMEAFGGATFETQLLIHEDPWEFLRKLNKATPNTALQALIRGQNLVSKRNFADDVVELFIKHAAKSGVDVFRVFDPLNDLRNMEASIAAALKTKKRVQGALCYAVSPAHNLELWGSLAKGLVNMGCHEIVIKDTSGLLSPQATWELVSALRQAVKVPIDVHSHCSSGMAPMAYMAAVEAGADVLDVAMSPLAWGASQPAAESVVAALEGGEYDTGLDLARMWDAQRDVEDLKRRHIEHLSPVADRVDASILRYHMPGLMIDDIYHQLSARDATDRLNEVLDEANHVRRHIGYPPLVAPIRQMIATQAVYNVLGGERYATVTQELKDYLQGLYGRPPAPVDPELRRLVIGREEPITIRPADLLEPQVEPARQQVRKMGFEPTDDMVLIHLMFPGLAADYARGPQPAKSDGQKPVIVEAPPPPAPEPEPVAVAADPSQSAEFDVEVEGEVFKVRVSGAGLSVIAGAPASAPAGNSAPAPPKVGEGTVLAPMQGLIVKIPVKPGDDVKLGDVVAVLEAMKMQNDIVSTVAGRVTGVYVKEGEVVTPNQPLLTIG
ncbi:MAG TPA: pyruvate carboxylase subunit B [Candidatus Dormibacteraeota bacterium]|nr:pyruvate carboxylase subunit B [Candidatus Dormibacteraeota bacterium]